MRITIKLLLKKDKAVFWNRWTSDALAQFVEVTVLDESNDNRALEQTRQQVPLELQIALLMAISEAIIRFSIANSHAPVEEKRRIVARCVFPLRDAFHARLLPSIAARFAYPNSTAEERDSLAKTVAGYYIALFSDIPDDVVPFKERFAWLQQALDEANKLRLVSLHWTRPASELIVQLSLRGMFDEIGELATVWKDADARIVALLLRTLPDFSRKLAYYESFSEPKQQAGEIIVQMVREASVSKRLAWGADKLAWMVQQCLSTRSFCWPTFIAETNS
jgi:hypothetical protein